MQFGRAVDGFGLQGFGCGGCGVFEAIDGTVLGGMETPGTAEVDDAKTAGEGFGNPGAGLVVGGGEEEEMDVFAFEVGPLPGVDFGSVGVREAGELGMEVGEALGVAGVAEAAEEEGRDVPQAGMAEQKASEFGAGVAADAGDGDAGSGGAALCLGGGLGGGEGRCESLHYGFASGRENRFVGVLRAAVRRKADPLASLWNDKIKGREA